MPLTPIDTRLRFGDCEICTASGELLRDGRRIPIQRQPFALLAFLTKRAGSAVTREELYAHLWPTGTFVDFEHGLNTVVRKLRRALRDAPDQPRFIETVPGCGYRFVAEVERLPSAVSTREDPGSEPARRLAQLLARPPFVGRDAELARLERRVAAAAEGRGGLVLVAGEPGIGKTRLLEEVMERARRGGAHVLAGRCAQGSGSAPYEAFAEALARWVNDADAAVLRESADGAVWSVIAKLVPRVRGKLPELSDAPPLRPDEERLRLFDAVAQLALGMAKRRCVLLVLDDLHWADAATLALLAHVARMANGAPLIVVGAFRDVEVDHTHPLAHLIDVFARDASFEQFSLTGLTAEPVRAWLDLVSEGRIDAAFAEEVFRTTNGNPFFLRELILGWTRQSGCDTAAHFEPGAISVPQSVRAMVERRLAKLSEDGRRLLVCASAFPSTFFFEAAANAAALGEDEALDALDEVHQAQLVRPCGGPDDYEFVHALIRAVAYEALTPARRMRVHRRLAEEMAREAASGAPARSAEIAEQYHASRELPGAAKGVPFALAATDAAEAVADFEGAARLLRMALDLADATDPRRPRLLGRLALALAWSGVADEAVKAGSDAGDQIAASEGADAAAEFLADMADAVWLRGWDLRAWPLAAQGLRYAGARRDWVWVRLALHQVMASDAFDPEFPGLVRDTSLRREVFSALLANRHRLSPFELNEIWHTSIFDSREDVIERAGDVPAALVFYAGRYRAGLELYERQQRLVFVSQGALAGAAAFFGNRCATLSALGDLDAAAESLARATEMAVRIGWPSWVHIITACARGTIAEMRGSGTARAADAIDAVTGPLQYPVFVILPPFMAFARHLHAFAGDFDKAFHGMDVLLNAAERFAGWSPSYVFLVTGIAGAFWQRGVADPRTAMLEFQIREKVLKPDFRFPTVDARLAVAQLCALDRRFDEASQWFVRAREVLDEQGARPLRAITDFDEALMYVRRGARGDAARVRSLLDTAVYQFEAIGMPGWVERAERLLRA